ncbi:hypothetical protein [Streptomyces sp. CAI-85]|uniref:hypothetical protein n=1 Tax=Streptomyces sp. CAI-85 TaxID=1472662 RepID=UPI0015871E84|nr:hypothetical protein [Streptomyces sp. CAI-85]NUV61579.1 hypothetical protein [Streptomyces sp. CAI-85]
MYVPTPRNVRKLTDSDFTKGDVAEFHRLMAELLATCRTVVDQYEVDGVWSPSTSGLFTQFGETVQVMSELSRRINETRSGMRRITGRARERLYERDARLGRMSA